jgi:hypothetical protein
MDDTRYPTEEELSTIENYDVVKDGVFGLLELVNSLWVFPDYYIVKGKNVLKVELHTGGWSGNEDIIGALMNNTMFWTLCWEKSVRGGHYYFTIREYKK